MSVASSLESMCPSTHTHSHFTYIQLRFCKVSPPPPACGQGCVPRSRGQGCGPRSRGQGCVPREVKVPRSAQERMAVNPALSWLSRGSRGWGSALPGLPDRSMESRNNVPRQVLMCLMILFGFGALLSPPLSSSSDLVCATASHTKDAVDASWSRRGHCGPGLECRAGRWETQGQSTYRPFRTRHLSTV